VNEFLGFFTSQLRRKIYKNIKSRSADFLLLIIEEKLRLQKEKLIFKKWIFIQLNSLFFRKNGNSKNSK